MVAKIGRWIGRAEFRKTPPYDRRDERSISISTRDEMRRARIRELRARTERHRGVVTAAQGKT